MKKILLLFLFSLSALFLYAQSLAYPYPVRSITLPMERQGAKMAFMDVHPEKANGKTVLLLHGKNFNGYYWKEVIRFLKEKGYRVLVPDQVGWGLSDKPDIQYSFHRLAANTKKLLDTLRIPKVHLVGHSMGGMLAARFTLMYPEAVEKLVFENPIGLEDYKTFVPYQPVEVQFSGEMKATYESLKKYQQSYYPVWKEAYEPYVAAQWAALQTPSFEQATWVSARTYEMIYAQPVVYEFKNIRKPTLLIIGQEDRTVVGKNLLSKEVASRHGQYPKLGRWLKNEIKGSKLVELKGVGHIPHLQVPEVFQASLVRFLKD